METVRTVVCKLAPTPEQVIEVDATLRAFAAACDRIAAVARSIHSTNKVLVQKACYREVRETFGLSANLTIRAIARACAALKVPEKAHSGFDPTSIDYDARIFSFREWDRTFSLTLLRSRQRIEAKLGERQRSMLRGRKPTAAVLVRRRDGGYYLHVQLTDEAPGPIGVKGVIGLDMGVKNLAVTDDGEAFGGASVEACRQKYQRIRKTCQKTGTKSAKRKLCKVRAKESRYRKDVNHVISRRVIDKAKGTGCAIGIEDLEGIGERTTVKRADRSRMKGWAFFQLRAFLTYKALAEGIPVIPVDPRNTSRTCSGCGHCEKAVCWETCHRIPHSMRRFSGNEPGPSDLPTTERYGGPQHVGDVGADQCQQSPRPARPAWYGQSYTASSPILIGVFATPPLC
jgi:putative transposase